MKKLSVVTQLVLLFIASNILLTSCEKTTASETVEVKKVVPEYLSLKVENDSILRDIIIRGSVDPVNKITLTSEVQGKIKSSGRSLKTGTQFRRGENILSVDANDFYYTLNASRSKFISALNRTMSTVRMDYPDAFPTWENYLNNYDMVSELPELPVIENAKMRNYFVTNNIFELYYSVKSMEESYDKYVITAPFNGSITASFTEVGEMLVPNMPIAEYSGNSSFEMEASVSLKDLKYIHVGQALELFNQDFGQQFTGKVVRINQKLENQTQSLKIYIRVQDTDIKGGMFLEGKLSSDNGVLAFSIPRHLLKRNNEVYVIRNSVVHLVPVSPLFYQDNMAIVSGLTDGDLLINEVIKTPITGIQAQSKNR